MKRVPRIASDTGLPPGFIAWCVWDEAGAWLGQALPRRWLRELVTQANTVYVRCGRFRSSVRGTGDRGRDYLWMFMRHWLAAKLKQHRPHLHARMPASYNVGAPLPPKPIPLSRSRTFRSEPRRLLPPLPSPVAEQAWAAAAHFHL